MKIRARAWLFGIALPLVVVACSSSSSDDGGSAGTPKGGGGSVNQAGSGGKGGATSGGTASGGAAKGGTSNGGAGSGGKAGGGASTAGSAMGGVAGADDGAGDRAGASGEAGAPAVCTAGATHCVSTTQLETCNTDGQWGTPSDCEFGCSHDACASNYALSFDGTDDIVTVPFANDLDVTNALTIEAWVYAVSANGGGIASMWGEGGLLDKFLVQLTGGEVVARIPTTSGQTTASATMPLNTWTHVAFTYDGATMILYLDGVKAGSTDVTATLPNANLPFRLGIEDINLAGHTFFNGKLDEVRFWNVARSATDIAANYQASISPTSTGLVGYWNFNEAQSSQTVSDATGHGHDGTLGADATAASDDPVRVAR